MKIRIKGNSIRLRLTQTEVANFAQHGQIIEQTEFINATFSYVLKSSNDVSNPTATLNNNTITLQVPAAIANNWTSTNLIGFDTKQPLNNGNELFILVEKDFVCLDNTLEDQSDNYPNPNAEC
ncbi:MAG: hypothetical protein KBE91_01140 [Bacteroidia bacterium]|nr:hypothetical protein [Bacteroidia bacterium]MBP9688185.1 hypothetical protein [Bacteroidia bacterium]